MQTLTWYINRLGRMSPAEVAWRAGRMLRAAGRSLEPVDVPAPRLGTAPRSFIHVPAGLDPRPYEQAAARIMRGEHDIFDLRACILGRDPDWNRDPATGRIAPLVAAGMLDYRDEQRVGNIKYLWEVNRHLHLVPLAQAYALTQEARYAEEIRRHVSSWIEQCPPGRGANWASPLELGIRLVNWSLAWQLLGGAQAPIFSGPYGGWFRAHWLDAVYLHARAITGNLSRYSSANNHLIGEACGVWVASVTWPYWPELARWGRRCRAILAEEALRQNAPDGGNREQAVSYQQFVCDFLLLAGLAARAQGEDFSSRYWLRLESMLDFIASLLDAGGHMPMIGDADDGLVVRLSPQPDACPYRSLLATGARLFERPDLAAKAASPDDPKTQWLLGAAEGTVAENRYQPITMFPDSGYYVLGRDFGTPQEIRLIVDAGPLGYLSLAAHGHADALAVVLSVGGHEVLIDPGTYAYHTEPEWRRHFRGTAAHNTLEVDGQDQSVQEGSFMWSRHAVARCLAFETQDGRQTFSGEHDGYTRLADPVMHRRIIEFVEETAEFSVTDLVTARDSHRVCRCWHFAPSLHPEVSQQQVVVHAGAFTVTLSPIEDVVVRTYRGGSPAEGGWYSRSFAVKEPCTTVVWESTTAGSAQLGARIRVRPR